MQLRILTYTLLALFAFCLGAEAQEPVQMSKAQRRRERLDAPQVKPVVSDSLAIDTAVIDSAIRVVTKEVKEQTSSVVVVDTTQFAADLAPKRFIPDGKKALWYAIAFPGGGQIYNRKFWKLPIIYGGFLGCMYAVTWNNTMYSDYSQAYSDLMDSNPDTKSYMNFVPPGYDVVANAQRLQELFRRKKDYYRRYRDLSIFAIAAVYLLSIIDAYVDAELSSFDISRDISMKVKPTIINDHQRLMRSSNELAGNSYGLKCSVAF